MMLLLVPAFLLLAVFFFLPLWEIVDESFGGISDFTLKNYDRALTDSIYLKRWRITFEQAISATSICLLLGYPVAYYLATSSGKRRFLVLVAVIIPFLAHFVAQTVVWRIILGRRGWINETMVDVGLLDEPWEMLFTRFSVMVGMVQTFLPLMVLCIYAGMRGIPRGLTMVAEGLGATPFNSFRRVYLPLSMPGVWAGMMLVFVLSAGSFAAPDILGNIQHRGLASSLGGSGPFNTALAVLLFLSMAILFLVFVRFIGFSPLYRAGEAVLRFTPEASTHSHKRRVLLGIIVGLISLYLLLPTALVIILSVNNSSFVWFPPRDFTLKWYKEYFAGTDPLTHWKSSTVTSLELAVLAMIISLVLGGLISYSLVRGRYPGKAIVNSIILAPLVIPTVVVAGAIFRMYFYGEHLRFLMGSLPGFLIPHTILALPYVVIILTATLRSADVVQEQAAMSLGAGRLTTFRRVLLPQVLPGVGVAAFLSFLASFNEVVVALALRTRSFQTLPMNIWSGRNAEYGPMMGATSTLILLAALVLLVGIVLLRKRVPQQPR